MRAFCFNTGRNLALNKTVTIKIVIIKNKKQIIKSKIVHVISIMNNFLVRLLELEEIEQNNILAIDWSWINKNLKY